MGFPLLKEVDGKIFLDFVSQLHLKKAKLGI